MNKYMVLYLAPVTADDMWQNISAEESEGIMALWMAWFKKHEDAILEGGSPLGNGMNFTKTGRSNPQSQATGYNIMQAADLNSAQAMLSDHPHYMVPGASIDVLEMMSMAR